MSLDKNVVMNTIYNAGLITLGAVGTSMVSKKLMKYELGVSNSSQGIFKLTVAVGGGSILVKYVQKWDTFPKNLGKTNKINLKNGRNDSRRII